MVSIPIIKLIKMFSSNGYNSHAFRLCRICVTVSENLVVLENELLSLFEYCMGLSLTIEDNPWALCEKCADKIKSYATFKEKCHKSNNLWQSVIKKVYDSKLSCDKNVQKDAINKQIVMFNNELRASSSELTKLEEKNNFDKKEIKYLESEEDEGKGKEEVTNSIKAENDDYYDTEYLNTEEYKDNVINYLKPKEFSLDICGNKLSTNQTGSNASKEVLMCEICNKQFKFKKKLEAHIKTCKSKLIKDIGNSAELECGLCNLSYTNNEDMDNHLAEHWSNNDLKCQLCDYVGLDLANIFTHRFTHIATSRVLHCQICKKNLKVQRGLEYHYREKHLKKPGGLCKYCRKEIPDYGRWKRHERGHTDCFICDYCERKFSRKKTLADHIMGIHWKLVKHICETCGRKFKRLTSLKSHIRAVHVNHIPIKCSHCNRVYKNKSLLAKHMRSLTRERPFPCEMCHKTFAIPSQLKDHMIWHSDDRPFRCKYCNSSYRVKGQLIIHMRSHSGDMPYKCQQCPRTFSTPGQLKIHMSVHTGVRKHKCSHCERSFHQKKLLRSHCLLRHKIEMEKKC